MFSGSAQAEVGTEDDVKKQNNNEGAGGEQDHQQHPRADKSNGRTIIAESMPLEPPPKGRQGPSRAVVAQRGGVSLTATMENGVTADFPHAVWLGRVAKVMEARGDRDEAVRLYAQACSELTGCRDDCPGEVAAPESGLKASGALGFPMRESSGGRDGDTGWVNIEKPGGGKGGELFPYSARAHFLASCIERTYRRHFLR